MSYQGGYQSLKSKNKSVSKKKSSEELTANALDRIRKKVGDEECESMQQEFKRSSSSEQDGMILTLISSGASQLEIRALFKVGGYRVARLQQRQALDELPTPIIVIPKHACSVEEQTAVKDHILTYDLEPGYPCAHNLFKKNLSFVFLKTSIENSQQSTIYM